MPFGECLSREAAFLREEKHVPSVCPIDIYLKFSCARQPTARTPRDYRSVLNNFAAGSLLMRFVFQPAVCNAVAVAAFQEWPLISSVSSLTSVKKLALPRVRVFRFFFFCFLFRMS